jgi:hypothetical protein
MESFTKFAEESLSKISNSINGGDSKNEFLEKVFAEPQIPKDFEQLTENNFNGGDVQDILPPSIEYYGKLKTDYDYFKMLTLSVNYLFFLGVFVALYWLFSPGQMLQLYNSRKHCNSQVYGKGTLGTSFNPSVDLTYSQCKVQVLQGMPSPITKDWSQCNQLLNCSKKSKWGTFFTSVPAILIHGLLLGVVLSLLPGLHLHSILKPVANFTAYLIGWLVYLLWGLPSMAFYDSSYGNSFMPSFSAMNNFDFMKSVTVDTQNPFKDVVPDENPFKNV